MKLIKDLGTFFLGKDKRRYGLYECPKCGSEVKMLTENVKRRKSENCNACGFKGKNNQHGMSGSRLYKTWADMKNRCKNTRHTSFKYYGDRGITVCDEWKSFTNFMIWATSNGYDDTLEIDRIDIDKNYEPSNCRWVNERLQSRNKKRIIASNTSGFRGVSFNKKNKNYCARITVDRVRITIGTFKLAEEAGYNYDKYIVINNLEHTTNGLYKKEKI